MVLSTMTALLIVAMAMYFSVVSSRSVQYAVFNQQQSYQSASSISDVLLSGLKDGTLASGSNDLLSALNSMNIGDSISTGDNGFITLGATGGSARSDEDQVGAYSVDITRLNDEEINGDQNKTFDIATTTYVNGVAETVHTFVHVKMSGVETDAGITQVFASTGYVPNDAYLEAGIYKTDVFFDTEYTVLNAYGTQGGGAMSFDGNFYCGGSLTLNRYISGTDKEASVWAIRNNFTTTSGCNQPITLKSGSVVMIGGDMDIQNMSGFLNADIYVNGDVYLTGNQLASSNLYVNGNIYLLSGYSKFKSIHYSEDSKIYIMNGDSWVVNAQIDNYVSTRDTTKMSEEEARAEAAKIFVQDSAYSGTFSTGYTIRKWDGSEGMSYTDFIKQLDETTSTCTYYKWIINDGTDENGNPDPSRRKLDSYVKELDEANRTAVHKTFDYVLSAKQDYLLSVGADKQVAVHTVEYEKDKLEGFILDDITCLASENAITSIALIIDTGDDPNNVFTIRVSPNRDYDGDGIKESFSWYPFDSYSTSVNMSVLVKGRGSLVVDIPKGVTYQDERDVVFMHYNWFTLLGGKIATDAQSGIQYFDNSGIKNTTAADLAASFIHRDCCESSGDKCSYTEKTITEKCKSCGEKLKTVTCSVHEYTIKYCPKCDPNAINRDSDDKPTALCNNRVDRQAIDTYLAANSSIAAKMEKDINGDLVYPTTNIFLVSCDESASIRISTKLNNSAVIQNAFFGYIYAPYMTFKSYGENAGGGFIRFCGGMTVSDYVIATNMAFLSCWPERLPTELMGQECFDNQLNGIASRGWKITLGSH